MSDLPVVLVLGPTASGKTGLAVALARRFDGEVISADAMAVYRGMDVGTAKPAPAERGGVPHHCLDWLEPEDRCDVSRWLTMADAATAGIAGRGRLPIIAGGSPLYTKAYLEGLSAGPPRDETVRRLLHERYAAIGGEALLEELRQVDPDYAADRHPNDQRRIVRALEVHRLTGRPYSSFHVTDGKRRPGLRPLLIGLRWDKPELHRRINARAKAMFAEGLIDEVRRLRPRLCPEAAQAVGYKEVIELLDGRIDEATALYHVQRNSRQLAKQQLNWYRRFRDIHWLPGDADDVQEQAAELVVAFQASS